MSKNWKEALREAVTGSVHSAEMLNEIRTFVQQELSPQGSQPVDRVIWVPITKVSPNDYNPNSVAKREFDLLYTSIKQDGFTQPIVTILDRQADHYTIIDGFHRYSVALKYPDILASTQGLVPVVVLSKDINERMAATVRHNRARGSHSVNGMANLVFSMLDQGWEDSEICQNLGMSAEELVRLKHVTGFSALFKDVKYGLSWKTRRQIRVEAKAREVGNG